MLAIAGASAMNAEGNNVAEIVLVLAVASYPMLIAWRKPAVEKYYPFILFGISLALLMSLALISDTLFGHDIQFEYYFAGLTLSTGHWSASLAGNLNAMLSVTILVPILSMVMGASLNAVLKVVLPLIYALVPVLLYWTFKRYLGARVGFFASLYFAFSFVFFSEMLQLARQEIAEVILAVLLLFLAHKGRSSMREAYPATIILTIGLVVSHYGIAIVFLLIISFAYVLVFASRLKSYLIGANRTTYSVPAGIQLVSGGPSLLRGMALFLALFLLVWYTYVAGASVLTSVVGIGSDIYNAVVSDLFRTQNVQALSLVLSSNTSPLYQIEKYLYLVSQVLVVIGIVREFLKPSTSFLTPNRVLAGGAFVFLILLAGIPFLSNSLDTSRSYHIALFLLAPYFVTGAYSAGNIISRAAHHASPGDWQLKPIAVFLAIFLLFNSGLLSYLANETPSSMALSNSSDFSKFSSAETASATWLIGNSNHVVLQGDQYGALLLERYFTTDSIVYTNGSAIDSGYLFAREWNTDHQVFLSIITINGLPQPHYGTINLTTDTGTIFSDGGSRVYFIP